MSEFHVLEVQMLFATALKKMLHLDERHHLVGFTLNVRSDSIPTATIELEFHDDGQVEEFVKTFTLVKPIEEVKGGG